MSAEDRHYDLEIQDLIDGRLEPDLKQQVESHLARCQKCKSEFDALRGVKQILKKETRSVSTPARLRKQILDALDVESVGPAERKSSMRKILFAAAVILALLLTAGIIYRTIFPASLPSLVAQDFKSYASSDIRLQILSEKPEEIEKYFQDGGILFETRVFDLAMMEYHLRGGKVHQLQGRPSALFVYQGPGNIVMVCQMFPGTVNELPQNAEMREHNGIRFFVYQQNGISMVFWQEGDIVCVLASDAKKEDVIQLAFAKAVRV